MTITWAEARQIVKERNINERQFRNWLYTKDAGQSPEELLDLIVQHLYHSTEDVLYAPPHLRKIGQHRSHQIECR